MSICVRARTTVLRESERASERESGIKLNTPSAPLEEWHPPRFRRGTKRKKKQKNEMDYKDGIRLPHVADSRVFIVPAFHVRCTRGGSHRLCVYACACVPACCALRAYVMHICARMPCVCTCIGACARTQELANRVTGVRNARTRVVMCVRRDKRMR